MGDPDTLRDAMLVTGERLLKALALEHRLNRLSAKKAPDSTVLEKWRESRRDVERLAEEYVVAIEHYRQALWQAIPKQPNKSPTGRPSPFRSPLKNPIRSIEATCDGVHGTAGSV